jgi:hypothetical protein
MRRRSVRSTRDVPHLIIADCSAKRQSRAEGHPPNPKSGLSNDYRLLLEQRAAIAIVWMPSICNYAVRRRWPDEAAFLQSFGVQRQTETVIESALLLGFLYARRQYVNQLFAVYGMIDCAV